VLISNRTLLLVFVVKGDCDSGFGNTSLATLVNQFLQVCGSDMAQISDAKEETNSIQNVGFATTIQASDGIEHGIKAVNFRPLAVGFESIDYH